MMISLLLKCSDSCQIDFGREKLTTFKSEYLYNRGSQPGVDLRLGSKFDPPWG